VHLDEFSRSQGAASDGAALELPQKGHDVDEIEDVAFGRADGTLEGRKGEGTAVEGEFDEGDPLDLLLAFPVLLHFSVGDVHLILRVAVLPHLL
jgi:hypothetical protein